jgi:serine/threonine protein kinase
MTDDHRQQVLQLYHLALGHETESRDAFLIDSCAGDADLRRDVEALLAQDPPSDFLQISPVSADASVGQDAGDGLIGRQIGTYRVTSKLGAGGMGEVFRAHDTKLGRDVAIKILPHAFDTNPERRARFEREARVLATLNHPNIGAIYGLEDANGTSALILELIEGETLAERLARIKPAAGDGMPAQEALTIARQIADALEVAHERGIVHRDLKPANIKFAANGSVKVLDFGLAKAMFDGDGPPDAKDAATRTGAVMGTVAYMSPEQAKGEKIDKRTDIWAFGCVLYEMLTRRPAFAKATGAETVAAVLDREPDWNALPIAVSATVRMVLERCLQKDPKERFRDIGDVRLGLAGAFGSAAHPAATPLPTASAHRSLWSRASPVAASLVVGGLLTTATMQLGPPRRSPQVTRLALTTSGAAAFSASGNYRNVAITPDGLRVVYVGDSGQQLFMRALDQVEPVVLATGRVLREPFIAPDGQWIGFEELYTLKKVPIAGGPAITLAEIDGVMRGATWLPDNTIVFATNTARTGLQRISADGGMPTQLTKPDPARNEYEHVWPEALPGGTALLYTIINRTGGLGAARVAIQDLQANHSTDLLSGGSNAVYVPTGHLVYVAGGALWGIPFDLGRRATFGTAVPILKEMLTTGTGAGEFDVSANGTLVYGHGPGYDPLARTLSWVDRQGNQEQLPAPPHPYLQPRISHDGTRIVTATLRGPESNIWVWDMSRQIFTRVTTGAALDIQPTWSSDDRWIVFASQRDGGTQKLWQQLADGTGVPERLTHTLVQAGAKVTPDGARVIFHQPSPAGDDDLMEMTLNGTHQISPLVQTRFNEQAGVLSPEGRWLAYHSDISGRQEIYVRPYPNTEAGRWQVSTAGGQAPMWSRDGKELFFTAANGTLMGVKVEATRTTWAASPPLKVLEPGYWSSSTQFGPQIDVSPDGRRFLVVTAPRVDPAVAAPHLVLVQHWGEELKARVPLNR